MSDPLPQLPTHESHTHKPSPTAIVSNVLVFVGFAVLVLIIVWGLFHIASFSTGWFSNMFKGANASATLIVHAPAHAEPSRATRITWQHTSSGGRYAFLYECAGNLTFGIPLVKQGETTPTLARVACGTAFTLGNETSSLLVVPLLGGATSTTANISIVYVPTDGGKQASGSARMQIGAPSAPATPEPAPVATVVEPTKPVTPVQKPAPVARPADLVLSIDSASTDYGGNSIVSFTIKNTGGTPSGTYYFTATLPTSLSYTYQSEPQASLSPGSHIVNTLRFTNTISGIFTAIVDPSNTVRESNESNNALSHEILRY